MSEKYLKRNGTIDLIKGIGIILMVFRHARTPYTEMVVLFHMALFFMASGFLYNSSRIYDVKSMIRYILKKIKSLWVPYAFFTTIFLFLNNFFIKINVYTNDAELLKLNTVDVQSLTEPISFVTALKLAANTVIFRAFTQIGNALWFFQTLFFVVVLFGMVDLIIKKIFADRNKIYLFHSLIALIFLMAGYFCYLHNIFYIYGRAFSAYSLMYLGYIIKNTKIMDYIYSRSDYVKYGIILITFGLLLWANGYVEINIASNNICNPIVFITMSFAGWVMIYGVAILLQKFDFKIVNNIIAYISIYSVPVVALHFLCFKLVSAVGVKFLGIDNLFIAAFPVYFRGGIWWLFYSVIGIAIPLILDSIWRNFKIILKNLA